MVMKKTKETQTKSFTDFFIERPIFAWVINIVLILLGLIALTHLSIRQYPRIEVPIITVTTGWSGASVSAIESQVTKPLEDSFSSIEGLDHIESNSDPEQSKIKIHFSNRAIDAAFNDVNEKLNKIKLPEECDKSVITKADADAAPVMQIVLTGENYNTGELFDMADRTVKGFFETIDGVAAVDIAGGGGFQMNLVLDPIKMEAYHVTAQEVVEALKRQNIQQRPAGKLSVKEREFVLTMKSCLNNPHEFSDMIVSEKQEGIVRVSDIGTASVCPDEEKFKVIFNGKPGISFNILPQPQANPMEIAKQVKDRIAKMETSLPKGMKIEIAIDKTVFIEKSIGQVYKAIWEASILVLIVIFVFLCSFRASLIPLITIPISLISSLFIMYLLGFTINIISLLALVLAIGLVVDDAIVVLENVYRYIERGVKPYEAAILGTREIRFSIIAMTLTLAAVYAPIAYAPGMMAKIFKEFALTLAGSVLISGFIALTLSPAMCARLLREHSPHGDTSGKNPKDPFKASPLDMIARKVQAALARLESLYTHAIEIAIDNRMVVMTFAGAFFMFSIFLGVFYVKKTFTPIEDQGMIQAIFSSPPASNLAYLTKYDKEINKIFGDSKEIKNRLIIFQTNEDSYMKATLVPWEERDRKCRDILPELMTKMQDVVGISSFIGCPSSGFKRGGGEKPLSFLILTDRPYKELEDVGVNVMRMVKKHQGVDPRTVEPAKVATLPEFEIVPKNLEYAHGLGIDPDSVARMLTVLVRGSNYTKFEKDNKMYSVHIWIGDKFRTSTENILSLSIKGHKDRQHEVMVPLKHLVEIRPKDSQPGVQHYGKKRSFNITTGLTYGYGLGSVYSEVRKTVESMLPSGYFIEPVGELKSFLDENKNAYFIFGLSIIFIFLVLAAQFESLRAPFIILLSVPLAIGGAILTLALMTTGSLNVYSQIGCITLIGLITKHGILLVDFANQAQDNGLSRVAAIIEACRMRLRPILMTTFAMVLGALPLALASGAGQEARQQIGAVIVGGMTIGTLFTLFVIPVVYTFLGKIIYKDR